MASSASSVAWADPRVWRAQRFGSWPAFSSIALMADRSSVIRSAGTSDSRAASSTCSIACVAVGSGRSGIEGGSIVATRSNAYWRVRVSPRSSETVLASSDSMSLTSADR